MEQLLLPNTEAPGRKPIQLIKYMGSKRGILDFVIPVIKQVTPKEVPVIDLFAGTHSVGYALAADHPIYANDIQQYSAVIGRALLSTTNTLPTPEDLWRQIEPAVSRNQVALGERLSDWLDEEAGLLRPTTFDQDTLQAYKSFQEDFPYAGDLTRGSDTKLSRVLKSLLNGGKKERDSSPWALITVYFNNAYFSLRQAVDLDSLRRAIDDTLPIDSHAWNVALACLLHTAGYCTPSPGHFAQFRQLNSVAVFEDIARYRLRSVKEYFLSKYTEFHKRLLPAAFTCHVGTMPHLDYLRGTNFPQNTASPITVYADPPYSFVHYSRFYHVLETLVRYDYPACEFFGRYRDDRYQSKFCHQANAVDEFKALVAAVRDKQMNLVLSYADTALVPLDKLIKICKKSYEAKNVEVVRSDHQHATMGRNGDKSRDVEETAIVCRL